LAQNAPHVPFVHVSVPLNANELPLQTQRAELRQTVSCKFQNSLASYAQTGIRQRWRDSRRSDNMWTTFLKG